MSEHTIRKHAPLLDWRGGGWVLAASGVVVLALLGWAFSGVFLGTPRVGDGRHPESYGFDLDLSPSLAPHLAASGNPRDFLRPLDGPELLRASEVPAYNESHRMRAVVPSDQVVGIVLGSEARAWPVPLLNVHELVHDTVGGIPVCVTWSPLTRSAVILDRRIDGRERHFALSGLLLAGNLLFYDTTEVPSRSLWSQLAFGPVSGPAQAAGERFDPLPGVALCSWESWSATHPESTVALAPNSDKKMIKDTSYARWYAQRALPPGVTSSDPMGWKAPILAYRRTGVGASPWLVAPLPAGTGTAGFAREVPATLGHDLDAMVGVSGALIPGDTGAWQTIPSCAGCWDVFHPVASQSVR
ncbi:MAG: DUF3179 domain-containing (seleno)protein [Planctomycetota bacterium]|nr:DUF3179 domain-containing (seleno)protein [Planctomycetota bacterium]MDA1105664.1 DUF3179 domain-containing (seleno)protein [Planctomycetota bacterium]